MARSYMCEWGNCQEQDHLPVLITYKPVNDGERVRFCCSRGSICSHRMARTMRRTGATRTCAAAANRRLRKGLSHDHHR